MPTTHHLVASLVAGLAIALLSACGGGGGDAGTPSTTTIEIPAIEQGNSDGANLVTTGDRHTVGDDELANDYRGLIRIPLSAVPAGSNVVGAFLNLSFLNRLGTPAGNQINNLGALQFIRIDGFAPLAASDYNAPQRALDPANNLVVDLPNTRPRIGILQPLLSALAAGDTHLTLRLQYQTATNSNGVEDAMEFASLAHASELGAVLEVILQ